MRPFVSGLVLAAGGSARLGQPKQLLPFRGRTLLGWVMAQVAAATSLDEVGCSSSYRVGVGAIDPRAAAVAVLLIHADITMTSAAIAVRVRVRLLPTAGTASSDVARRRSTPCSAPMAASTDS
jgi:hypothetical protein